MIISSDAEKSIQQMLMINILERSGKQVICPNIMKAKYNKLMANIKLDGEKLNEIPLKSGIIQSCQLSLYLSNIVLKVLVITDQGDIQIRMEEVILSFFEDDMIVYISNPKSSSREILQLINILHNVAG